MLDKNLEKLVGTRTENTNDPYLNVLELHLGCSGVQRCIETFGTRRTAVIVRECSDGPIEHPDGYRSCGFYFKSDSPGSMADYVRGNLDPVVLPDMIEVPR